MLNAAFRARMRAFTGVLIFNPSQQILPQTIWRSFAVFTWRYGAETDLFLDRFD